MNIYHLSAECYPVAKAGGLADVVGALPKYMAKQDVKAQVVMPKYDNDWMRSHTFETEFEGDAPLGSHRFWYRIQREADDSLGFPLYVIDIPERFQRPGIYLDPNTGMGYWDEFERYLSFQIAALDWINFHEIKPDIVHCHDHHTALVPFMMTQSYRYEALKQLPTVLTIHNAEYQGVHDHSRIGMIPPFDWNQRGILDWDGYLNSLAAGLKTTWKITTVSPSYMEELRVYGHGLALLFENEKEKSQGILNGIDDEVWDPQTDPFLEKNFGISNRARGKRANKEVLCEKFGLNSELPTISYIGRFAHEKGADLLPNLFGRFLDYNVEVNFIVLGTGDPVLQEQFKSMKQHHTGFFNAAIDYNEPLAHLIYGGSDFLIMPSRVEPCGLNQMYAMRYGTIPVVRKIGGMKDTVTDVGEPGGFGVTFEEFDLESAIEAIERALSLFDKKQQFYAVSRKIMRLDFSWNVSAKQYIQMYIDLIKS